MRHGRLWRRLCLRVRRVSRGVRARLRVRRGVLRVWRLLPGLLLVRVSGPGRGPRAAGGRGRGRTGGTQAAPLCRRLLFGDGARPLASYRRLRGGAALAFNPHWGAIIGGITSLLLVGTLIVGSQTAVASKQIVYPTKPTSTIGCSHLFDITTENVNHTIFQQETVPEAPFILFRISFMYFNPIGCLTVLTVGSIVSWFARTNTPNTETVNRDLLSPVIYRWLSKDNINKEIIVAEPLLTLK